LVEIRNLFAVGFGALIALLTADGTVPDAHLWTKTWFVTLIWMSVALVAVGLYGYMAHYRWRSVPLVLIAVAATAVVLHQPPIILGLLAVATFLTTWHFLSPERDVVPTLMKTLGSGETSMPLLAATSSETAVPPDKTRVFITRTPLELLQLCTGTDIENRRVLEPYFGKWLRVSGKVNNVVEHLGPCRILECFRRR